jgi:hypothetical protein
MIALIAAAVASLSGVAFDTALEENLADYWQIKAIVERHISQVSTPHDAICSMQGTALDFEAKLQKIVDLGVMDDHPLTPDQMKVVISKVHQLDFEARGYAARCAS